MPIIEIVVLKFSNFCKSFFFGDGSDDFVQLLEFWFSQVRKIVEALFEPFIELLLLEDQFVVGLVKSKFTVLGLLGNVFLAVVREVFGVGDAVGWGF